MRNSCSPANAVPCIALLLAVATASCASGQAAPPDPKPEVDCRQTAPNLIHVLKSVTGQAAKKDSYEFCVSRDGALLFDRGSGPVQRKVTGEQMQSLQDVLSRASQKQSQEIAHVCTHVRSLLVEWTWSGKSYAAHEACDDSQPVVAHEVRDSAWRILKLDTLKPPKK
jgi:hypothetical protein